MSGLGGSHKLKILGLDDSEEQLTESQEFRDDEAQKVLRFFNDKLNDLETDGVQVERSEKGEYVKLKCKRNLKSKLEKGYEDISNSVKELKCYVYNFDADKKGSVLKRIPKSSPHLLAIVSPSHNVVRVWSDNQGELDKVRDTFERKTPAIQTNSLRKSRKERFSKSEISEASGIYAKIDDDDDDDDRSKGKKIYSGGWSPDIKLECSTQEGLKVKVYKGSITKLRVDAIVNAANEHLSNGAGVAGAISDAAGDEFDRECKQIIRKKGNIPLSENYVTGGGDLPCGWVIHAVGPQWHQFHSKEKCLDKLKDTVVNVLQTAYDNDFTIVVMPPISSGIFGVPKKMCAAMYILGIVEFSTFHPDLKRHVHELHIIDIKDDMLKHIEESYRKWKRDPASIEPSRLLGKTSGSHGYTHQNNCDNYYNMPHSTSNQDWNSTSSQQEQQHGTRQRQTKTEQQWICRSESRKDRMVYILKEKLQVHVYRGDVTKAKVDAIVSTENRKFDGSGGLSRAIREAAGYYYDDKLRQKIVHKHLYHSQVFRSSPGNLKQFRCILHVIIEQLSAFTPPTEWQLSHIENGIWNILEHGNHVPVKKPKKVVDHLQFWKDDEYITLQTIAMPLLGAGAVSTELYIETCCERVFGALLKFVISIRRRRPLKLKEIHFIDNRDIIIDCMNKVFKKKCIKGRPLPPRPRQHEVPQKQGKGQYGDQAKKTLRKDAIDVWCMDSAEYSSVVNVDSYMVPVRTQNKAEPITQTGNLMIIHDVPEDNGKFADKFDNLSTDKGAAGGTTDDTADDCIICMDSVEDAVKLEKCGHMFCRGCISESFKQKPVCPVCNTVYGSLEGDQPTDGKAYIYREKKSLPGYEKCQTIMIEYDFADGTQGDEHPEPGEPYKGLNRHCYLPDNKQGNKILKMLKIAFEQRLIFTIGQSRTSGEENVLTWNDIHHKTRREGGPEKFGYPDPEYLERVEEELNAKGIEI